MTARRVAVQLTAWFLIASGVRAKYYDLQVAFGPSMLPTLAGRGEYIIVDKWSHRSHLGRRLQKGDIVTVLRPDVLGRRQTKRITAMEGDTVTYTIPFTDQQEKTVMVPRGHVWVEGDNPLQSHDSKHYGAISMNLVEGRVLCQIWPTVCSLIA